MSTVKNTIQTDSGAPGLAWAIAVILLSLTPAPAAAASKCGNEWPQELQGGGIWAPVTARTTPELLTLFTNGKLVTVKGETIWPQQAVLAAMRDAVLLCGGQILSLGEGRSTLIYNLLSDRSHKIQFHPPDMAPIVQCGHEGIHAVDVIYPQHDETGAITDPRKPSGSKQPELGTYDSHIAAWIQRFPLNYHSQMFQTLDLRSKDGTRLRFKLIFSAASLSYVLFWDLTHEAIAHTLDRIMDHLAPGGMLIMSPGRCCADGSVPDSVKFYYKRLAELRAQGIVEDFNILGEDFCKGGRDSGPILAVIKSSPAIATPALSGGKPLPAATR